MNHSMINALTAMQSLQQKLDVHAHNIANVNTVGYKRRDVSFQDILTNVVRQPEGFRQPGRLTPLGLPQGWGARVSLIEINVEQGSLNPTGNPLDLAIEGHGLFEVILDTVDENGNPRIAWTRDGSFQLSVSPAFPGMLVLATQRGEWVSGIDDNPVLVPADSTIEIDDAGRVFARNKQDPEGIPEEVGQIKLVRYLRPQVLVSEGNNLFTLPPGMDPEGVLEVVDPVAGDRRVSIRQGFREQANVSLPDELAELIVLQRAFALNARAVVSSDTIMSLTNNLRA